MARARGRNFVAKFKTTFFQKSRLSIFSQRFGGCKVFEVFRKNSSKTLKVLTNYWEKERSRIVTLKKLSRHFQPCWCLHHFNDFFINCFECLFAFQNVIVKLKFLFMTTWGKSWTRNILEKFSGARNNFEKVEIWLSIFELDPKSFKSLSFWETWKILTIITKF